MKIRPIDRFQALRYSKKYRKDYNACKVKRDKAGELDAFVGKPGDSFAEGMMSGVQLSTTGRGLCSKYRICYPFDPYIDYERDPQMRDALVKWVFPPVMFLDSPKHWLEVSAGANLSSTQISQVNGRLVITIDPTYALDQIIDHVENFLAGVIEPTMDRLGPSETLIDHWMVYRKKEFEGKSLVDIARGLAGKSKQAHPSYDAELKRVDKNVRDAYKRAKAIVQFVEKHR